jgi:type IX secretion system PorP/SprF family membrane protein
MNTITKTAFLCLLLVAACELLTAQVDPHFSQYYVYPSWLNPALTGAFDGECRVSGIYRNQWGNISSPFSTQSLAGEFTTNKNANFGVSLLNQKAGNGGYSYTTAYGSYSYTGIRWGRNEYQRIAIGIQGGIIRQSFDPSKMTFGDQWNPITGYNGSTGTGDVLTVTNHTSFDGGMGLLYFDADPEKKANIFGGVSVSHVTKPTDKFSGSQDATIPVRYLVHGGVRLFIDEGVSVTPNLLYVHQGSAEEKMAGAVVSLKASEETDVKLGLNYRYKDAIAPYVGYTWQNMIISASYDVNTSTLGKMIHGSNAFEVSLSFTAKKKNKTTPAEFVCPRL